MGDVRGGGRGRVVRLVVRGGLRADGVHAPPGPTTRTGPATGARPADAPVRTAVPAGGLRDQTDPPQPGDGHPDRAARTGTPHPAPEPGRGPGPGVAQRET